MSGFHRTKRLLAGLFIAVAGGWAGSAPASNPERRLSDAQAGQRAFAFTFAGVASEVRVTSGSDGYADVRVDGFRTLENSPGVPDLPRRTLLLAIPPGATPRLEYTARGQLSIPALPRPVPALRELAPGLGKGVEGPRRLVAASSAQPDPRIYEGTDLYPEQAAWLGEIGVLRDQRYVEVHLAPLRYDPTTHGLVSHDSIEVTVRFDGGLPLGAAAPDSPLFESLYRTSLINYDQGREFRLSSVIAEDLDGPAAEVQPAEVNTTPRQRIHVRADGIVRIAYAELQAAGFGAYPMSRWRLTGRGVLIPLHLVADGDDTLEVGESIQFYGQVLDHEPEATLQTAPDLFAATDFTDENTYFLDVAGTAQPAMTTQNAASSCGGCTPPDYFDAVQHVEVDDAYRPLAGADPWYWAPSFSAPATRGDLVVQLPGLHSGTAPVDVHVRLRGLTPVNDDLDCANPDHLSEVRLLDCPAGNCLGAQSTLATNPGSFDGRVIHDHDFTWTYPGSGPALTNPAEIQVQALTLPVGGCPNTIILDEIELGYRRSFAVIGDRLAFEWPDGTQEIEIDGLVDTAPTVYEVTEPVGGGPVVAVRLTGGVVTSGTLRFRINNDPSLTDGTPRRFAIAGASAISTLPGADFIADTVSDLRLTSNQADYLVIAHPDTLDDPATCPGAGCPVLTDLLDYRETVAGGDLTSKVVLLQDVYDEFNDGLPGPQAIRNFLGWVLSGPGWALPKPTYVLLLGDGSYDYKRGEIEGNYVPTQIMFRDRAELGYYASDNLLAAVVGSDSLADLAIGRIPARTPTEADNMLQKTLDYDQSPPQGAWLGNLLFVSDRGHADALLSESEEFEARNDESLLVDTATGNEVFAAAGYAPTHLRYYPDYYVPAGNNGPAAAIDIRTDITNAINEAFGGTSVVQFIGHGNWLVWSDDAFIDERHPPPYDMEALTNGPRLPFLMAHNCLTGGFHYTYPYAVCQVNACSDTGNFCVSDANCNPPDRTVGEDALRRVGGGAVAVFSPTGLSFNFITDDVVDYVWGPVIGDRKERRVAVPVLETLVGLCTTGRTEACQNYELLGDPALKLALPNIGPPTGVEADGGHQRVDLTWTASSTPGAQYNVYRKNVSTNETFYSKITPTPVSGSCSPGCSFANTGLVNAQTYRYYIVAVAAGGHESRVSNFNSQCPSGPDCAQATPLNPNAPAAPTGVAVSDPGTGSHLNVSWFASAENDLAGYTIYYGTVPGNGTAPGTYTHSMSVPANLTAARLEGLAEDETYYVAMTATNTSSLTSVLSAEDNEFPVFGPGLHLPDFIDDLRVRLSGNNVILEWGAVTEDIYGKPISGVSYQVYRGTSPSSLTLLGPSPTPAFTDVGAKTAPNPYFYWVRAVAGGLAGGLGAEVPASILTLDVAPSQITPGGIRLSWPPVTTTLDGTPLALAHYAVYIDDAPFGRQDIANGQLPAPLQVTSGSFIELPPPAGDQYYSVLAVDIRGNRSPF